MAGMLRGRNLEVVLWSKECFSRDGVSVVYRTVLVALNRSTPIAALSGAKYALPQEVQP
jgi:hypothetical protein